MLTHDTNEATRALQERISLALRWASLAAGAIGAFSLLPISLEDERILVGLAAFDLAFVLAAVHSCILARRSFLDTALYCLSVAIIAPALAVAVRYAMTHARPLACSIIDCRMHFTVIDGLTMFFQFGLFCVITMLACLGQILGLMARVALGMCAFAMLVIIGSMPSAIALADWIAATFSFTAVCCASFFIYSVSPN